MGFEPGYVAPLVAFAWKETAPIRQDKELVSV